jgi:hypothetical protein
MWIDKILNQILQNVYFSKTKKLNKDALSGEEIYTRQKTIYGATCYTKRTDKEWPVIVDKTLGSEKHMLTVLWSVKGPLVVEWLDLDE